MRNIAVMLICTARECWFASSSTKCLKNKLVFEMINNVCEQKTNLVASWKVYIA